MALPSLFEESGRRSLLETGAIVCGIGAVFLKSWWLGGVVLLGGVWVLARWLKNRTPDSSEDSEKPFISFVLLLRETRSMDDVSLARIVEEAWTGDYSSGDEEAADGFVVGETPLFMLKAAEGMYVINNFEVPYFEDTEEVANEVGEMRLRKALLEHEAWISVDLISPVDESLPPESFYPKIIRLIIELADEDTLVIMRPETGQINLWSDDVFEQLIGANGLESFNHPTDASVIPVHDDDVEMQEAVAEARRRWPEFAQAFRIRVDDELFSVKAPVSSGGEIEFIWIDVVSIDQNTVQGTLANDPVDLVGMKLGSKVEVHINEINDWAYGRCDSDDKPEGLFTVKAVMEAQMRFRERCDESDQTAG